MEAMFEAVRGPPESGEVHAKGWQVEVSVFGISALRYLDAMQTATAGLDASCILCGDRGASLLRPCGGLEGNHEGMRIWNVWMGVWSFGCVAGVLRGIPCTECEVEQEGNRV